ncbi:MAG: ATP-binding domain-containing protein, partial [Gemmataceae bacterium]|nr:ATP-binding domain-containing protein [Gemmataceae bacterium]
ITDDLKGIASSVRPGDLVICRKNAPLVGLTYRLVLAGVPAVMRGREIGRGLLALITRLKPASLADLIDRLEDYREREVRRLVRKSAPQSQHDNLNDRCDCLGQLAAQVTSLEQLETFIAEKFDDAAKPGASVVLSSVHRAKGLEADMVYVLDPSSLPLRRKNPKPWETQQELNLCYVCVTRAKKTIVFEDHVPSIFGVR